MAADGKGQGADCNATEEKIESVAKGRGAFFLLSVKLTGCVHASEIVV